MGYTTTRQQMIKKGRVKGIVLLITKRRLWKVRACDVCKCHDAGNHVMHKNYLVFDAKAWRNRHCLPLTGILNNKDCLALLHAVLVFSQAHSHTRGHRYYIVHTFFRGRERRVHFQLPSSIDLLFLTKDPPWSNAAWRVVDCVFVFWGRIR